MCLCNQSLRCMWCDNCKDEFFKDVKPYIKEEKPKKTGVRCPYNDCGWCYYEGDAKVNASNRECQKPRECVIIKELIKSVEE